MATLTSTSQARGGKCRAVDPSTNPYLAAAMFLGAGLDGIEQDLDPGDPQFVNMYELSDQELADRGIKQLPQTLLEAITAFENDDLGRRVMGDELRPVLHRPQEIGVVVVPQFNFPVGD